MRLAPRASTSLCCAALPALLLSVSVSAKHHHQHQHQRATVHLLSPPLGELQSGTAAATSVPGKPISASDANAIVSAFLGVDEYEYLRDGLEVPDQVVYAASHKQYSENTQQPLIIIADKLSKDGSIEDYLSEDTLTVKPVVHSMTVDRSPSTEAWVGLARLYSERLSSAISHYISESTARMDKAKRFLLGSFNGDYSLEPSMQDEAFQSYMESLSSLAAVQDGVETGYVHLTGVPRIAHKFGRDSKEVQQARDMLRLSVDAVVRSHAGKIVFVMTPPSHSADGKRLRGPASQSVDAFSTVPYSLRKRQAQSPGVRPIVSTGGLCYTSQDQCSNSTASCSGHGACVQGRRVGPATTSGTECWVCQCAVTKDTSGRNRYYGGSMCQKEDLSSQTFLLVGSVFLLVFICISAVALLGSVGSEPLPSTLSAMSGATSGGHHKRD